MPTAVEDARRRISGAAIALALALGACGGGAEDGGAVSPGSADAGGTSGSGGSSDDAGTAGAGGEGGAGGVAGSGGSSGDAGTGGAGGEGGAGGVAGSGGSSGDGGTAGAGGSASSPDYWIRVGYPGPVTLNRVEVRLFTSTHACSDLVEDSVQPPTTDMPFATIDIEPEPDGTLADYALDVPAGTTLQFAVARGEPSNGSGSGPGYFVTFGCNDEVPALTSNSGTIIDVDTHNLWPDVAASYDISSKIGLPDPIPAAFAPLVASANELMTDPGAGLLRVMALTMSELYWTESPFDVLFDCPKEDAVTGHCLETVALTPTGVTVASVIESQADAKVAMLPGAAGSTLGSALGAGQSIFNEAADVGLRGSLLLTQPPDASGVLGGMNSMVFNQVDWNWSTNVRTISLRPEFFVRAQNIEGAVMFHPAAQLAEEYALALGPHALSLDYADLIIWVLEGVVFPEQLGVCDGYSVDSLEDLMSCLLNCSSLAVEVTNDTSTSIGSAIEASCEQLQSSAAMAMENWSSTLTRGQESYYQLNSPPSNPCVMGFDPGSSEFLIQSLGQPSAACAWEGEMRFTQGQPPSPAAGSWWAERL